MATELLTREPGKRKTALVTIDADNRDRDKRFLITEMPATRAERWFRQLVAKLSRDGIKTPAEVAMAGMAALPSFPLLTYLSWIDDEALIGEIMGCVQCHPPGAPLPRAVRETDTEEIATLVQLKMEVIALHVGFSLAVVLWSVMPALAAVMNLEQPATPAPSSGTPTSPTPSPS
jgi:hypothetical protein